MLICCVYERGLPYAAMPADCGRMFARVHHAVTPGSHAVECERLLHRLLHVTDGYRRALSIPVSVCVPDTVPYTHGLLADDALGTYALCCKCKRTLFHSIKYLWNAVMHRITQRLEGKSDKQSKSRTFDSSAFPVHQVEPQALLEAIAAMTYVRVQEHMPFKQLEWVCRQRTP